MFNTILLALNFLFCINLTQAQTPAQSPPSTAGSSAPTAALPPIVITPAPPAIPSDSNLNKPVLGKYQEYQSICRLNEYDNVFNLSADLKAKRVKLLQEKIKKGKDVNRLQLRLLKEFIDQRKTNEANEIYANIKKLDLSDDESNLADGYIYFFQKKYKKAQSLVEKIVTSDPRNIEIAKFLGEIYRGENNFFEAASVYNDLNKKFSGGYYDLLCEVLILDSHHADGMKACKKAQLEKPTNPYPLIYMGISSREKEGSKDTYRYFMDSLSVKQTEMARTCLAELYFIDRDYKSAIEHYKKALESSPQSLRALSGLGWAELQNKNNDAALQSFKKLCQMDHKYVAELRKAYKILTAQNSPEAKRFAENIQSCTQ